MKRKQLMALIILLIIGFASVTTTLIINGTVNVGFNNKSFDVYFSNALVNGEEDKDVIKDDTHISFIHDMSMVGETYKLEYDVTNGSKNYDALLTIECTETDEYIQIENEFDTTTSLVATGTRSGVLTITVIKPYVDTEENPTYDKEVVITINATPVDRESLAEGVPAKKVINSKSFAEDSWETIQASVQSGEYIYQVGDTKQVTLAAHGDIDEQEFTVRVANTSPCTNGEISETACGFVVEFVDIIENQKFNSGGTNAGGWEASELRSYINETILNALPNSLKGVIADTTVVSSYGSGGEANFVTSDKLYLLSSEEVLNTSGNDTSYGTSRQLDYYQNENVTNTNSEKAIKQYAGADARWWLRSADSKRTSNFLLIKEDGKWYNYYANISPYGISPAFRIG